jgi:hypothetical protein
MTRPRTELTAYAGILASIVAVTLMLAAPWHAMELIGALILASVPAGAGVMCWLDSGEWAAQAGLILTVSLAVLGIASAIMIWATAWHPHALYALAAASTLSCAVRLRRGVPR